MRKTLLGMVGTAALVFGVEARAGDASADAAEAAQKQFRSESHGASTAIVQAERAAPESRFSYEGTSMKPCEPSGDEGSASGEPSARDAERSTGQSEFLRNVWTAP